MSRLLVCYVILFYFIYEGELASYSLEMVPERAEITYLNPHYVGNATISVRRSTRRGRYVVNVSGYNMQTWDNNVTLHIRLFEFLHNEYRPSFVQNTYKLCDFLNKDVFGTIIRSLGVECPLLPKYWVVSNGSLQVPSFPYKFPFSKARMAVSMEVTRTQDPIAKADLYVTIKTRPEFKKIKK